MNDFDGDGDQDLLWRNTGTGQASLWDMDGGVRTDAFTFALQGDAEILAIREMNGDAATDVLARQSDGTLVMFEMQNDAAPEISAIGTLSSGWELV